MKVLGLVFSIVGNIGTFVMFLVTLLVMALGIMLEDLNLTVSIILMVLTLVLYIIAVIGNKIQDNLQNGLKVKIIVFRLLGWIPDLVSFVLSIVGILGLIFSAIMIFSGSLDVFEGFTVIEENPYCLFFIFGHLFINGIASHALYSDYIKTHCKHCGCNLKGGDYEYEEVERMFFANSSSEKRQLVSKIRFEFTCPECGEDTVYYKKMSTDAEKVDKYARSIVGND